MKAPTVAAVVLWTLALLIALVSGDVMGCTGTAVTLPATNGNQYCSAVTRLVYQGVGGDSFYKMVTDMNNETGECSTTNRPFSGKMSPLDEDVSPIL
jgi:hypothetical protein